MKRAVGIVVSLFLFLGLSKVGLGHQFPDFDLTLGVGIDDDVLTLEYRIWYGPVMIPALRLDNDSNTQLEEEELYAYLNRASEEIRQKLEIEVNKIALQVRSLTGTISSSGTYPDIAVDLALWYQVSLPEELEQERHLIIRDNYFSNFRVNQKVLYLDSSSRAENLTIERNQQQIDLRYTAGNTFNPRFMASSHSSVRKQQDDNSTNSASDDRLSRFLKAPVMDPVMLLTAFITAFFLGAAHALSPGHGKAMVAAYLVGTGGRKKDAVLLGLIVTFTHVFSVLLLGVVVLYLSTYVLPAQILPWLTVASGALIFFTGFLLMIRRREHVHHHRHGDGHSENDQHDHHHNHGHSLGSLLSMGIAGGMIPCPSALVVLLVSVSLHKIVLGMGLIIVFSLGLASVLVAIGIAVVSIAGFTSSVGRFSGVINLLPVFSAGLILLLGIVISIRGLIEAGILQFVSL